jgi:hypothetical protein
MGLFSEWPDGIAQDITLGMGFNNDDAEDGLSLSLINGIMLLSFMITIIVNSSFI